MNEAGAYSTESAATTGLVEITHGTARKRSGSFTQSGTLWRCSLARCSTTAASSASQRVPVSGGWIHERFRLIHLRQTMELPRMLVHKRAVAVHGVQVGRDHPAVGRQAELGIHVIIMALGAPSVKSCVEGNPEYETEARRAPSMRISAASPVGSQS